MALGSMPHCICMHLFPVFLMALSFSLLLKGEESLMPLAGLKGFIQSGRGKNFSCSPLTGLHFLFVCFPVSVMVNIIN